MKSPCCLKFYEKTTVRIPIAIMTFFACFMSYCVRLSFNFAILVMVYPESGIKQIPECQANGNITRRSITNYGGTYHWDLTVQGHLKAAYGYGYFVAHFPAGFIADALGPRWLVLIAISSQAVLTALVPLCCTVHWGLVFVLRCIAGLAGGMVFPALHALVSQWSPPQEKGKFIFSLMGGTFASVVIWPIVAAIIDGIDWPASFYIVATMCVVWCIPWLVIVYDTPEKHPCISPKERYYIRASQGDTLLQKKPPLPWCKVLTSVPFMALVVAHFGNLWGLFLLTTDTPVYLNEVLGFNLKNSGFLGSMPSLGRLAMSFFFGAIVDYITSRHLWENKTSMRKTFIIFSHLLPGVFMLFIGFVGCNITGAVALLITCLAMNGASTVTNLVNHHDLAPNYAGILYGIMNGIGTTTLFIVPSLTGYILKHHNGIKEWQIIFGIGAAFYVATGIVFLILGSGNVQSWNNVGEESPEEVVPPVAPEAEIPPPEN